MGAVGSKSPCCAADKVKSSTNPDADSSSKGQKSYRIHRELYHSEGDLASDSETNFHDAAEESVSENTPQPFHTPAEQEKARDLFYNAVQSGKHFMVMHYDQEFQELDLLQTTFENGENCLHVAVRQRSHDLIMYCLTNGLSPNAKNNRTGDTALHTAVREHDVKIATLLCKHGAICQIQNFSKESPLDIARDQDDDDLLELLDPNVQRMVSEHLSNSTFTDSDLRFNTERIENLGVVESEADFILSLSSSSLSKAGHEDTLRSEPGLSGLSAPNRMAKTRSAEHRNTYTEHTPRSKRGYKSRDDLGGMNGMNSLKGLSDPMLSQTMPVQSTSKAMAMTKGAPFGALKRTNTKKVLHDMKTLSSAGKKLPQLTGWLDRKSRMGSWKTQWVTVKKGFILWNHEPRDIKNVKNRKERQKFKGSWNLMQIVDIKKVTAGKTQRKFTFAVGSGKERKEFMWRCGNEKERNYWVNGLHQHQKHIKSVVSYLKSK